MMSEVFNTDSVLLGASNGNTHDVILHGLDQSLKYGDREIFYPVEPFQEYVTAWDGVPAVYVPSGKHIPPSEFNSNPELALKKYNGKIVGEFRNSEVLTAGQKRLQSQLTITDENIESDVQEGNIRLSSAFNAVVTDRIKSPIRPSYVLLFPKSSANPRDKTSMFLNNIRTPSEETNMEEAVKIANLERDLSERDGTIDLLNTEMSGKDAKIADLENTVEVLNSEAGEKDSKIAELEAKVTEFMNTEADRQWEAVKATLPKGLVATPEAEKELRELMNTDVLAYTLKITSVARPAETDAEGVEFMNNEGAGKPASVGNWNPYTQQFEN